MTWPDNPWIYELNTWTWLQGLTEKHHRRVTLSNLPEEELDGEIGRYDAVWFMGVWERSPRGRQIALQHSGLLGEFRHALSDFKPDDVVGSPYAVRRYQVDEKLGGPSGLSKVRQQLAKRDIRLVLDFVPNHVAVDHEWTARRPTLLISGTEDDLNREPESFFSSGSRVFANGRDPYFPPWTDTAQINLFSREARDELARRLEAVAEQCDGIRCDMAMLALDDIFARTWGERAGASPDREFWEEVIERVKARFPELVFIAEAYWDTEWKLQQQGFDFCYDKCLYDRLAHEEASAVRSHLQADLDFQRKLVRFIENHDEPRAPVVFGERARAAAILLSDLPGAKLFHEGQTRGHRIKLPVQLGRRPPEPDDPSTVELYRRLHASSPKPRRTQQWRLCDVEVASMEGDVGQLIVTFSSDVDRHRLTVVNFGPQPLKGSFRIAGDVFSGNAVHFDLPAWDGRAHQPSS